jgi:hypothetical protein
LWNGSNASPPEPFPPPNIPGKGACPGRPLVYATERDAQREIADDLRDRLQQFLNGEREFDDAMTVEEYILTVSVFPDGTVTTAEGDYFLPRAA